MLMAGQPKREKRRARHCASPKTPVVPLSDPAGTTDGGHAGSPAVRGVCESWAPSGQWAAGIEGLNDAGPLLAQARLQLPTSSRCNQRAPPPKRARKSLGKPCTLAASGCCHGPRWPFSGRVCVVFALPIRSTICIDEAPLSSAMMSLSSCPFLHRPNTAKPAMSNVVTETRLHGSAPRSQILPFGDLTRSDRRACAACRGIRHRDGTRDSAA